MYESLKELPDFSDYSSDRRLPTVAEIRNRHLLVQKKTLLDQSDLGSDSLDLPVRLSLKRRWLRDPDDPMCKEQQLGSPNWSLSNSKIGSQIDSNYLHRRRPLPCLESNKDQTSRDIQRILDESLNVCRFHQHQNTLDSLDFMGHNFYRDPLKKDLKLIYPRKSYAGSLIERTLYW